MAINIEKNSDGDVTYKNPPVDRVLFPNLSEGATPEEIEEAVNKYFQEHPEILIPDGSILPVKLDSVNTASDGYVLRYNATEGKFEWYNINEELEQKANTDGYYEDMTVGDAEQLISSKYVENNEPYLYRATGGTADVGNREYVDAIVGGSLVFNQLFDTSTYRTSFSHESDIVVTVNGNVWSETGTWSNNARYNINSTPIDVVKDHVYLLCCNPANFVNESNSSIAVRPTDLSTNLTIPVGKNYAIAKADADAPNSYMVIFAKKGKNYTITVEPQVFDITQMFGTAVADAVYSAEQASAGAGVKIFRSLFPKTYYAYDAGTLKSVEGLVSHKMVGFNQWDEEWELGEYDGSGVKRPRSNAIRSANYIPCFPATTYYWKCASHATADGVLNFYDENRAFISRTIGALNTSLTTPTNAHFMTFYIAPETTYKNDICINLSWSGTRNGEYEPYKEKSYSLDSTLVLRGLPKIDATGKMYYDGDRYLPDGTVERRYGIVDLGTLNWNYASNENRFYTAGLSNVVKKTEGSLNMASAKFVPTPALANISAGNAGLMWLSSAGNLSVSANGYSDAAAFKTAMSGVLLVYELETHITKTVEPYQEVQICDDWGTEEYVIDEQTSIPVPVGHETRYPANLRDKLQHLPDLANADGYYLIKQEGTQMTLDLFRIPKAPETDGTYTLKATVSGEQPTYTWEVVS